MSLKPKLWMGNNSPSPSASESESPSVAPEPEPFKRTRVFLKGMDITEYVEQTLDYNGNYVRVD
jgi:hypothetical protein